MNLFLVSAMLLPTKKEEEEGSVPTVLLDPGKVVCARDKEQAVSKAMRYLPEGTDGKEDRIIIKVIPFQ